MITTNIIGEYGILPKGWQWVQLENICELSKGRTPHEAWYSDRGVWLVRFRDLSTSGINWNPGFRTFVNATYVEELKELKPNTVLITADAHDPKSIGKKICFINAIPINISKAYYSGELLGIMPKSIDEVIPNWILYWFQSDAGYREIQKYIDGVHLNVGRAKHMRIPLPPLADQKRIISVLNVQMVAIETARRAAEARLEMTQLLQVVYLSAVFNGAEATKWPRRQLGMVCNIIGGNTLPDPQICSQSERVYCLKVSDLKGAYSDGRELAGGAYYVSQKSAGARILKSGAIVFPKRGGAIATNEKRILKVQAILDPNLMGVQPIDVSKLMPLYLYYWFSSWDISALQSGNSVPQINKQDLEFIEMPIPNLTDQNRIVDTINKYTLESQKINKAVEQELMAISALPSVLLRNAFSGGL